MDLENRNELPNSLEEHWMPFTSNHDFKDSPRLMVKAEGMYYTDHHGNQLIDASSGLFCSPAGHGRQEIREAVYKQLEQLDYVQPFQQGFNGSFELARKISKHTPEDLNRIFLLCVVHPQLIQQSKLPSPTLKQKVKDTDTTLLVVKEVIME